MQNYEAVDEYIGTLRRLRVAMLVLSALLLLLSLFSQTVTLLEGVLLFAFSLFLFCQKELSPIAYRVLSFPRSTF